MRRLILWSILILTLAGILATFMLSLSKHEQIRSGIPLALRQAQGERIPALSDRPLLAHAAVPSFELLDQEARPFNSELLSGKVWIADFIFTSCAGTCPAMSERMARLQQSLPAEIHLVSVTVDPQRDSPSALARYADRYGADGSRWHFLTGSPDLIRRLVQQGFQLSVAEGLSPEEPIVHSVRFVLVDRAGAIRGYYDSTEPAQMEKLSVDAHALLRSS